MSKFVLDNVIVFITSMVLVMIMKDIIDLWIVKKRKKSIILFIILCIGYIVILVLSKIKMLYIEILILFIYSWFEYRAIKKKDKM